MSIWCSWPHIGTDPTVMYAVSEGMFEVDLGGGDQAKGRAPIEQTAERGNVLSYAEGFSNHYPDLTGSHERPAAIAIATIPEWCVPGCDETRDYDIVGPWLRVEVAAPEVLNFWTKTDEGNPAVEAQGATVLLDIAAATALRDDLTEWLSRPKAHPTEPPAEPEASASEVSASDEETARG